MAADTFSYRYNLLIKSNKKLVDCGPAASRFPLLQKYINLLEGLAIRGGELDAYAPDASGFTAASGNVVWTSAAAKGSGDVNGQAFVFLAGSAGACTVTVGTLTGITITGSGTAATDATALAAAITAAFAASTAYPNDQKPTVTANAGDVRIVWGKKGAVGNSIATVVTATGGGKLSAAGATLAGGTPTGALGTVTVVSASSALGNAVSTYTAHDQAVAIAAALNADAVASLYASYSTIVEDNCKVYVTCKLSPQFAAAGNLLTFAASVGTASGATLSGGVNATANNRVY